MADRREYKLLQQPLSSHDGGHNKKFKAVRRKLSEIYHKGGTMPLWLLAQSEELQRGQPDNSDKLQNWVDGHISA